MVLAPARCHGKRRGALPQQAILTRQCGERGSVLLRARDFLAASFFAHRRRAWWVAPQSRAPWRQGAVLGRRWWRCSVSYVARSWRWTRQREGRCGRAPGDADELGDAAQPVLIEVVDRAIAPCASARGKKLPRDSPSPRKCSTTPSSATPGLIATTGPCATCHGGTGAPRPGSTSKESPSDHGQLPRLHPRAA